MRVRQLTKWPLVAALTMFSASSFADEAETKTEAPAAAPAADKRVDELTLEQRKARASAKSSVDTPVKVKDAKAEVESLIGRQRGYVANASTLLSGANGKSTPDMLLVNCLTPKLKGQQGLLSHMEDRSKKVYEEIADSGEMLSMGGRRQLESIRSASSRGALLDRQVAECVGTQSYSAGQAGNTVVDVEIDGSITAADPTLPILPPPGPAVSVPVSDF